MLNAQPMPKNTTATDSLKFRRPTTGRYSSRLSLEKRADLLTELKNRWFALDNFNFTQRPIMLEIGCGMGDYLLHQAVLYPQTQFIACEVYLNGLQNIHNLATERNLQNICLTNEDARDLLAHLPPESIDTVAVLYPDPWPKNKQKHRRLVQPDFIAAVQRVLAPNGTLFMATDIADYATHMQQVMAQNSAFRPTNAGTLETPPTDWITTKYERKAFKAGRVPQYMLYQKI